MNWLESLFHLWTWGKKEHCLHKSSTDSNKHGQFNSDDPEKIKVLKCCWCGDMWEEGD